MNWINPFKTSHDFNYMDDIVPFKENRDEITTIPNTPLTTSKDKGGPTIERWDYQYGYTAKIIIEMFAKTNDYVSIYPEHHDDILVYCEDGQFEAYQVKTRAEDYEGFRFNDSDITNTIERFVNFENKFPNQFRKYIIVTNNGFSPKKEYSISNILEQVQESKIHFEPKKMDVVITEIAKKCNVDRNVVINVLKKLQLEKFSDMESYAEKIKQSYLYKLNECINLKKFQIDEIYKNLVYTIKDRTIYKISELVPDIINFEKGNPEYEKELGSRKRITSDTLRSIIEISNSVPILTSRKYSINSDPGHIAKMKKKMIDYGGIEPLIVNKIEDFAHDVDRFVSEKSHSMKSEQVEKEINQILAIVESKAHDRLLEFQGRTSLFGTEMLQLVIQNLNQLSHERPNEIFGANPELLKGFLGIMSCDCRVPFSKIP